MHTKSGRYSVVLTRTAALRVFWAGNILPPTVFPHKMVCAVGKLVSYDEGREYRVMNAVPFTQSFWSVVGPIYRHLWQYLEDPGEWVSPEDLKNLRLRYRTPSQFSPKEGTTPP